MARLVETFYPPTWKGRPPSMPWGDWLVWQRFLASPGALFDAYSYDVMLSTGEPAPKSTSPSLARMWRENTAKRMDAVAKKGDALTIIEVRDLCTWQTLGQVLGYQTLAQDEFNDELWTRPLVVCSALNSGIEPALIAQRISYYVVPKGP